MVTEWLFFHGFNYNSTREFFKTHLFWSFKRQPTKGEDALGRSFQLSKQTVALSLPLMSVLQFLITCVGLNGVLTELLLLPFLLLLHLMA